MLPVRFQQVRQAELDGREKLNSKRKVNEEGRDNPKTEHADADVEEMIPLGWKMLSHTRAMIRWRGLKKIRLG